MRRLIAALAAVLSLAWLAPVGALAQTSGTTKVVPTCDTLIYTAGKMAYPTQDPNGNACIKGNISASFTGFTPTSGTSNASLAVTNASGNVALPTGATQIVQNTGSNTAFITFSIGAGTATTAGYPLQPGTQIAVVPGSSTFINAITASSTTTLTISGGAGIPQLAGGTGSSSGGVAGFTAEATASAVAAGTNKPASIDTVNGAQRTELCKAAATTCIDPTLPSTLMGTDGATIMTAANPLEAHLNAGTTLIGKVGIDQTTPGTTNAVVETPVTTGGLLSCTFEVAASDNHQNCGTGAAHQVYAVQAFSIHTAALFMRLYNAASFNGCNSATNLVWEGQIPGPGTTGGGYTLNLPPGLAFSAGIGVCVTGAYGNTNTTNATASVASVNIQYK